MENATTLATLAGIICLLVGGMIGYGFMPTKEVSVIQTNTVVKEVPVPSAVNLTEIESKLDNLITTTEKDDLWEDAAFELATEEWEDHDYKDIFKAISKLYGDIVDREDINSVDVRDTEIISLDADDQDAKLVQEVKVKYEDKDGDDKKVYLKIRTLIEDGEVEDQTFRKA